MSHADRFEAYGLSLSRHSPYTAALKTIRSCAGTRRLFFMPSVHGSLLRAKKEQSFLTVLLRGTDGARTHDLPHVKRTLIPAELRFRMICTPYRRVEPTGLEPVTSRV